MPLALQPIGAKFLPLAELLGIQVLSQSACPMSRMAVGLLDKTGKPAQVSSTQSCFCCDLL